VILGHTNEAEYKKLPEQRVHGGLRDRTVKIDIPYITRVSEEVKIYSKDYTRIGSASTSRPTPCRWRRCGRS
jgi:serine protein kinase